MRGAKAGVSPSRRSPPCKCVFFAHRHFSLPVAGLFSCSRLRGTQVARPNTTAQVWALAEVRGTCSGGPKSQKLPSNHGEAFRARRAIQAHANPLTGCKISRRVAQVTTTKQQQQEQLAAAGHARREPVLCCGVRYVWIRPSYEACMF